MSLLFLVRLQRHVLSLEPLKGTVPWHVFTLCGGTISGEHVFLCLFELCLPSLDVDQAAPCAVGFSCSGRSFDLLLLIQTRMSAFIAY